MKIYLQVRPDGVITDCITYPHGDYVEHEMDYIPQGINGGWFKLIDGKVVEVPELKPVSKDDEIEKLKQEDLNNKEAIAELYMLSMGGS